MGIPNRFPMEREVVLVSKEVADYHLCKREPRSWAEGELLGAGSQSDDSVVHSLGAV